MPPLLLDDDEAIAIAVGLRTATRASVTGIEETAVRALLKLEQVLPGHLRRRVAALGSATVALPISGPTVDPQHLTVIAAACRDLELVRFGYRRRDGTASRREVEPHSLVNHGRRWYLVAWDRRREDWRTFRLDRLTRPAATGVRFTQRALPAKDAAAYVAESISNAPEPLRGGRHAARARSTRSPAACPRTGARSSRLDGRRCRFRTGDDDLSWLALRIAMIGVDFDVEEPPELVEQLRDAVLATGPRGRLRAPPLPAERCQRAAVDVLPDAADAPLGEGEHDAHVDLVLARRPTRTWSTWRCIAPPSQWRRSSTS